MKTLCVDARMINCSGIGTYLKNILRILGENKNYRLQAIICAEDDETNNILKNYEKIICKSRIYSLSEQIELPRKIKKCDLFWSPHYNIPLLPIKAKKRVVTIHDVCHLKYLNTFPFHKRLYAKNVINFATILSDAIITVSDFSKLEIQKYTSAPPNKIHRIYPGIDHDWFKDFDENKLVTSIRKKLAPPDKFLLFVGNIKEHKNVHGILQAFKNYALKNSHTPNFVIIGKQFDEFDLVVKTNNDPILKGKVSFHSNVNDEELRWFYKNALAAVLPSFYEGFGIPALEAMISGCPLLASNVASLPEVCAQACLYIDPYNINSMQQALKNLIEDAQLRQSLKEKGFENVKRFSWYASADQHMKLFDAILKNESI